MTAATPPAPRGMAELLGLPLPRPEPEPRAIASEATIGASHWVLEISDYRHSSGLVAALRQLAAAAPGLNPFFGYESLSASINRIDRSDVSLMMLWEQIGDARLPRLAFPFAGAGVGFPPLHVLRAWSHPYAPLGMPLIDQSGLEETVARFAHLLTALGKASGDCLRFDDFPAEMPHGRRFVDALAGAGLAVRLCNPSHRACLSARPGATPAGLLKPFANAKRRHELSRQLRRLSELGNLEFTVSGDFRDLAARLEEFLLLEAQGWKGRRRTSIHTIKRVAAYARQMVASFGAHGDARIHALRLAGRPIAALVLLRSGDVWYPWKTAFDERYAAHSPGAHLMIAASGAMLADPRFRFADSLARQDSWVEKIWPDRMALATLLVSPLPGDRGRKAVDRLAASIGRRERWRRMARDSVRRYFSR